MKRKKETTETDSAGVEMTERAEGNPEKEKQKLDQDKQNLDLT